MSLDELLDKHAPVFSGDLGCLNITEAKIYNIKLGAKPQFFRPLRIPYILRAKVKEELSRLQKNNLITLVKHSEWAVPIVPVLK